MSAPPTEEGRAALRAGDLAAAHRAFERALAEGESGAALEGLGEALYLEHDYAAAAAAYERAPTPPTARSAGAWPPRGWRARWAG